MRLSVFGCGNMGSAVVRAIRENEPALEILTYSPSGSSAQKLAKAVKGFQQGQIKSMFPCDVALLAMKPQQLETFIDQTAELFTPQTVIVSLLAGVDIATLQSKLNSDQVLRLMPNTPTLVGKGIITYAASSEMKRDSLSKILSWLTSSAKIFKMKDEDQLNRTMGVSASGPGLLFELALLFYKKLMADGLTDKDARLMVAELFAGSGELMLGSVESFEELRNNVTSKGGVTEASLQVLSSNNQFASLIDQALEANYRHSQELLDK